MKPDNLSFAEFQKLNKDIYLVVNDRNYSNPDMVARMHRHVTQILKAVRKEEQGNISYHLCMVFSWAVALANRLHIDLQSETWHRFPGVCPYCGNRPCACRERPETRKIFKAEPPKFEVSHTLSEWQKIFAEIYPNKLQNSAMHLVEELGEVDEAFQAWLATHQQEWFKKVVEELVDAITNIFGVANCLHIDLAEGLASYFANGCPRCHDFPCACGYIPEEPAILPDRK